MRRRWPVLAGLALGIAGGLAACENAVERQRVALCRRALPALVPPGTPVELLRAATAAGEAARVDYRVGSRPHVALCRFGAGAELRAVETDGAPLNGAALYFLKRYYLDTPDAEAADPARQGAGR